MTNDLNDHFFRPLALLACGGFKDNRDNRDNPFLLPVPACKRSSSKRTNIHNRWLSSRRLRSLRPPMMMVEPSSKRANIWGMFTARLRSPSSRTSCRLSCENPQVTFASLSSPAVMDIRPLRGRSSLAEVFSTTIRFPCLCSSLAEVLTTIETIGTIFSLFGYLHFL